MALKMSPVSRNLHAKVTLLGLELEDMLFLAMTGAAAMLIGQFFFADRYMFFFPMNWFLLLMVVVLGVPSLMLFKYGKPRGYLVDLVLYYAMPRSYCALAHDQKLKREFICEKTERSRGDGRNDGAARAFPGRSSCVRTAEYPGLPRWSHGS